MYGATALGSAICPGVGTVVGFVVGGVAGILIGLGLEWLLDEVKEWIF